MLGWWLACARDPDPLELRPDPVGEPALLFEGDVRPTNLLFVSFDTTRRDHLDPYAVDGVPRTDFLAARFAEGVMLDDHVQCSNWTYASTSCTLRGRDMEETGFYPKLSSRTRAPLPDGQPTLARRLGEAGFDSVLLSSNEWLSPTWNNAQGYDEFVELASGDSRTALAAALVELRDRWESGVPWFVHVHLVDPHPPYTLHAGYTDEIDLLPTVPWDLDSHGGHYDTLAEWPTMTEQQHQELLAQLHARYNAELRYLDDQIEAWWATIDDERYLEDTLVVFWNDHGEQFFERGNQTHAHRLNAEENDAFAVFWARNLQPVRHAGPTHSVDLVPTVLDAFGLPAEGDPELPGYIVGTAPTSRPRFAATVARQGPLVSVIQNGQKLVYDMDQGRLTQFDRTRDRAELEERYDRDDPVAGTLWRLLETRVDLLKPLASEWNLRNPEDPPR